MYLVDQINNAVYDFSKAVALKIENATESERLLHPAHQGCNYLIKCYYPKDIYPEPIVIGRYRFKEEAEVNFRIFEDHLLNSWPDGNVVDFSGMAFTQKSPDMEHDDRDER